MENGTEIVGTIETQTIISGEEGKKTTTKTIYKDKDGNEIDEPILLGARGETSLSSKTGEDGNTITTTTSRYTTVESSTVVIVTTINPGDGSEPTTKVTYEDKEGEEIEKPEFIEVDVESSNKEDGEELENSGMY